VWPPGPGWGLGGEEIGAEDVLGKLATPGRPSWRVPETIPGRLLSVRRHLLPPLWAVFILAWPAISHGQDATPSARPASLPAFLADPAFVRVQPGGRRSLAAPWGALLGSEPPAHGLGVFAVTALTLFEATSQCELASGENWLRSLAERPGDSLSVHQQQAAEVLARRWAPWFWQLPGDKARHDDGPDTAGVVRSRWRLVDDSDDQSLVQVETRCVDGAVVGFRAHRLRKRQPGKLPIRRIKEAAAEHVRRMAQPAPTEVEIGDWHPGEPYYLVSVRYRHGKLQPRRAGLTINGDTGEVLGMALSAADQPWRDEMPKLADTRPTYTRLGLAFLSTRRLTVQPAWVKPQYHVMLLGPDGIVRGVTADMAADAQALGATPGLSCLAFSRHCNQTGPWTWGLDLSTGRTWLLGRGEQRCEDALLLADDDLGLISGPARDGSADLFLIPPQPADANPLVRRRLPFEGEDSHPVVSRDGWIYFLNEQQRGSRRLLRLMRLRLDKAKAHKGALLRDEEVERLLAVPHNELLRGGALRLSAFPDGKRMLLTVGARAFEIVIGRETLAPVPLAGRDPDLKLPLTEITDTVAGPTDDQVTFSAKTTDPQGRERRRLYACRLTGQNLRALTPAEEEPVPPFRFTEDVTALTVARRLALAELASQDRERATARR
jgi:hypothetical protein